MQLDTLVLQKGSHADREKGMCAMEAVAWFAGEEHSDAPQCACPVITKFVIRLNDAWTEAERQLLKPYLPKILNTRDGNALKRTEILAMAACTKITPHVIEINFPEHAANMRAATDLKSAERAAWSAAAYAAAYAAAAADAYAAAAAAYAAAAAAKETRAAVIQESLAALDAALAVGK